MSLSKTAVKRLTKLADFMETVPPKHFNMGSVFYHYSNDGHDHNLDEGNEVKQKHVLECGSSACALGWAASLPYFRRLGLKLVVDAEDCGNVSAEVQYEGRETHGEEAFDLTLDQCRYLFWCTDAVDNVRTPKQWARRCRKFIKADGDLDALGFIDRWGS